LDRLDLAKSVFQVHGVNDADLCIPNDPLRLLFEFRDGGEGAHVNKPSYARAVLVRGVYHRGRFTSMTVTCIAKNVSGSPDLPLFLSAVAVSRS
jgi:hypothetical protein